MTGSSILDFFLGAIIIAKGFGLILAALGVILFILFHCYLYASYTIQKFIRNRKNEAYKKRIELQKKGNN